MAGVQLIERKGIKQNHLSQQTLIRANPDLVFAYLDDIHNAGWHMEKSSMPLMGSKMTVEILSKQKSGLGATYHWTGRVLGMPLDFSETVVKYVPNKERIWKTIGEPKIIIMSAYQMRFFIRPSAEGTVLTLGIDYDLPRPLFWNLIGRLLAGWYSRWCLTSMDNDARAALEK